MSRRLLRFVAPAVLAGLLATSPAPANTAVRAPCDPLDLALCMLPFPNDYFTRPANLPGDRSGTGKMINFLAAEMPRSVAGKPIDPTEWNRNDGFSPGSMVLTFVPGLDLHKTWGTANLFAGDSRLGGPNDPRDHIADIARYQSAAAPMLIIDVTPDTPEYGQRWPFWSELDMNSYTGPNERLLILRPAKNFLEGHRYAVGLRNMRDGNGDLIPASAQFASFRGGTESPAFGDHAAHIRGVIDELKSAEESRGNSFDAADLHLAWDFTVASETNLSERVLHIRDDAFGRLGDDDLANGVIEGASPAFAITKVTEITTDAAKQRQVEGTVAVPNYLDRPPQPVTQKDPTGTLPMQALPGARFVYGPDGLPIQNPAIPTIDVPFVCTIPKTASPINPAHPMLYGHGLLGSASGEPTGDSTKRMRERNFTTCATWWMGFAEYDFINAVATLADPSNMPVMADRSQQGFLNFLYLGRAFAHPGGFATSAAFQSGGQSLIKTNELFYDGNSQGGIMGGALCALSVDLTRCTVGVPGMNYSTLLNRSVDWEGPLVNEGINPTNPSDDADDYLPSYSSALYIMFPSKQEQQLVMALLQMLWDRAEANGYAQHMTTDPLPNTPAHQVLMHVAYGDFQVTNVSAEVEARTIGARVMQTSLTVPTNDGWRHWSVDPFFGLTQLGVSGGQIQPWPGSAIVYWDSGNLAPPNANVPPDEAGGDPHEDPRRDPRGADQKAWFYLNGEIKDVMSGGAYLTCRPDHPEYIPRVPSLFPSSVGDWCP